MDFLKDKIILLSILLQYNIYIYMGYVQFSRKIKMRGGGSWGKGKLTEREGVVISTPPLELKQVKCEFLQCLFNL